MSERVAACDGGDRGADDERYLFVVDYDEDAERKRAEYLFNNWSDGEVHRPSGLVRVATGADHVALYEQLVAKVPADQVSVQRLESVETEVEPESVVVEERVEASMDAVEAFLEYVLSKRKAVLSSGARNEYEVYTKKGRAEVRYETTDVDGGVDVRLRVVGYPPAPAFLADFFRTELSDYAASQRTERGGR